MVHRVLVTVSFVCCALVIASFAFFAADQASGASSQQVASVNETTPKKASTHHGVIQRSVDSAAKDLTYPFHSFASSSSQWENELITLILGLLLYGVGLGYLARFSAGWA